MAANGYTITGNVTRDPETRRINDRLSVTSFGIAHNDPPKKDGSKGDAHFFDVEMWGSNGEAVAARIRKGARVIVSGKLKVQNWEAKDGSKRSKVVITASDVGELVTAPKSQNYHGGGGGYSKPAQGHRSVPDNSDLPF